MLDCVFNLECVIIAASVVVCQLAAQDFGLLCISYRANIHVVCESSVASCSKMAGCSAHIHLISRRD